MKNLKNALLISLALTALVFIYYAATGTRVQDGELLTYIASLFGGVLVYLWFVGRRRK